MSGKRTDSNQAALVQYMRDLGAEWEDYTQQRPSVGYDGLCLFRGAAYPCEIKRDGKAKLTPKEIAKRAKFGAQNIRIWRLETAEDVAGMLGVI